MSFIYTQAQLKSDVNSKIKGKIGVLVDFQSTLNSGVRQVLSDIDLLTSRRRTPLIPALFNGVFEYAAPADIKGYSIISIQNQKWTKSPNWSLVPYEQFMRRQDLNTLAISDYDGTRKVFLKGSADDGLITVSSLDAVGTWLLFGDATNVELSTGNFVEGTGSIKFDISAAGGTTAGISNSALAQSDLSEFFEGEGSCVVRVYITSTTNLTNYILRIGSDSSNYYSKTVTTQADGTAFVNGWNILNFDLATFTTTGTPVITAADYCVIYFTKTAGKISEVGYKFDAIQLRVGEINNLYYYSGYGWQSSTGTYKVNSTTSSDILVAGEEEYELIVAKCAELAADDVDEENVSSKQISKYRELRKIYKMNNPSESLIMISQTVDFIKL